MQRESAESIFASVDTPMPESLIERAKEQQESRVTEPSPEVAGYLKSAKHYVMSLSVDGTLSAENVPAGDYQITVAAMLKGAGENSLMKVARVSVPSEPAIGVVDAGEILLEKQVPLSAREH